MSRISTRHVTHLNQTCHTYQRVTRHTHQRVISHTHIHESCHTYQRVMSHMSRCHFTHMNESCHTYERDMSQRSTSQVTRINESCHTHIQIETILYEDCKARGTGGSVWDVALIMSQLLREKYSGGLDVLRSMEGVAVIELGAGPGLPGLV